MIVALLLILAEYNTPRFRWRLVQLPIILSPRKPQTSSSEAQKNFRSFQPSVHNVFSIGTNFAKMTFYMSSGCVRFARYCGKMYSHHLFPYNGLFLFQICFVFFAHREERVRKSQNCKNRKYSKTIQKQNTK